MRNELKSWPSYFEHVWARRKTFDVRKDDKHYQTGDRYTLREWQFLGEGQDEEGYTGREVDIEVTYVLRASRKNPALTNGFCVFSFKESARRERE